jgi:type I restriction enzyme S subunit
MALTKKLTALLATRAELDANLSNQLRKSILQEAIQGKLVEQNPDDEPASVLLERIKQEKERLIKEKKIKRDKQDSIIYRGDDNKYYEKRGKEIVCIDEETPFDIPDNWIWTRLECITYPVGSKDNQELAKNFLQEGNYPVVSQGCNLIDGYSNDSSKVITDLPLIMFGDHTRNVKYIDFPFVIGADGTKFHKSICVQPRYLYYWMLYTSEKIRNRGYARHYSLLKSSYMPLPPLAEQKRIVEAIEKAWKVL